MSSILTPRKSKKIGLLIKQMRESHSQTLESCANWLGISTQEYEEIEEGNSEISLPQIESLSLFLDFPLEIVSVASSENSGGNSIPQSANQDLIILRNKIIAVSLKQQREEKQISREVLAQKTRIAIQDILEYEQGSTPIPFTDLTEIIKVLDLSLENLFSHANPHSREQQNESLSPKVFPDNFSEEMIEFITKPANLPYLQLAIRISKMEADKLRSIASSLLEITY